MLILANVEISKNLLIGGVGEQHRLHVFSVKLNLKGRIFKTGSNSLIDQTYKRIRRTNFVQNQNPADWF
jgi:hypothetical protein